MLYRNKIVIFTGILSITLSNVKFHIKQVNCDGRSTNNCEQCRQASLHDHFKLATVRIVLTARISTAERLMLTQCPVINGHPSGKPLYFAAVVSIFLLLLSFFLAYSQRSQIGCLPYFHT